MLFSSLYYTYQYEKIFNAKTTTNNHHINGVTSPALKYVDVCKWFLHYIDMNGPLRGNHVTFGGQWGGHITYGIVAKLVPSVNIIVKLRSIWHIKEIYVIYLWHLFSFIVH